MLEGLPSSSPAIERLEGFKEGIEGNPKIEVVAVQAVNWMPDQAETAFAAMLQAHPNIKSSIPATISWRQVLTSRPRARARRGEIKIIGTDGLPGPSGGIRAVADGEWAATFTYPTGAPQAIDMAKAILLDCAETVPTDVTVADDRNNARTTPSR